MKNIKQKFNKLTYRRYIQVFIKHMLNLYIVKNFE